MKATQLTERTQALWKAHIKFQRKTRMLTLQQTATQEESALKLSLAEAPLLHILASGPDKNVRDLAKLAGLEKSWASRIVADLEARKLVKAFVSESDKRSKKLRISARGQESLSTLKVFRARLMDNLLKDLSASEQKRYVGYVELFANGLGAPKYNSMDSGHALDTQVVRLSWVFGTAGGNRMGSDLNANQYQIFFELVEKAENFISASDLYTVLPIDLSTVTRTVLAFEKEGWLLRRPSVNDSRMFEVRLTPFGLRKWESVRDLALALFAKGLSEFSADEISDYVDLAGRLVRDMPVRAGESIDSEIQVVEASTRELNAAIAKILGPKSLKKHGPTVSRFAVVRAGEVLGGIQITRADDPSNDSLVFELQNVANDRWQDILETCLGRSSGRQRI